MLNGAVGVPARFSPPTHNFQVTSIPEDPDNDGRVATQSVTIVGLAERPGLGSFTDTHLAITIEALEGSTVVGSASLGTPNFQQDPVLLNRANFRIPVHLAVRPDPPGRDLPRHR